jgi:hypothetical protein
LRVSLKSDFLRHSNISGQYFLSPENVQFSQNIKIGILVGVLRKGNFIENHFIESQLIC